MSIKHLESMTYNIDAFMAAAHLPPLDAATSAKLGDYLALILRWNARMNLTSVRDPEGIVRRHFLESIACARLLPREIATLLDFGSGAGFPGIPIALCRPEIDVTLAESQGKKAAFLQEAVRTLGLNVQIHAGRAETLATQFDCVTLRAVDRMDTAVQVAARLVRIGGWLAPLTTRAAFPKIQRAVGAGFNWSDPASLPGSDDRVLLLATKASSPA